MEDGDDHVALLRNFAFNLFEKSVTKGTILSMPEFLSQVYFKIPNKVESLLWESVEEDSDLPKIDRLVSYYKHDFLSYYGLNNLSKETKETIIDYLVG